MEVGGRCAALCVDLCASVLCVYFSPQLYIENKKKIEKLEKWDKYFLLPQNKKKIEFRELKSSW